MHFYRRRKVSPVITIVSLVDILTMVLMFFVYTTTFKTQQPKEVQINLPEAKSGATAASPTKPALLSIKPNGDLFLDGDPIALDGLGSAMKKLQEAGRTVAMKADEEAPFGKIMKVLDELKHAGVEKVPALTRDATK